MSDVDRHYYQSHSLTLALHPSETEERMMIRLLAFALNASDDLAFGRGLSTEEDAALWRKDLTDQIQLWIDVGLPDDKRVKKASQRSDAVQIYSYGERTAPIWWEQNRKKIQAYDNIQVYYVTPDTCAGLVSLCERTMHLHCNIMDGEINLGNDNNSITVQLQHW